MSTNIFKPASDKMNTFNGLTWKFQYFHPAYSVFGPVGKDMRGALTQRGKPSGSIREHLLRLKIPKGSFLHPLILLVIYHIPGCRLVFTKNLFVSDAKI